MPNPLMDLPPEMRDQQVLYHIRFTAPYDGHRFIHSMLMSAPRKDRVALEHFKMRSKGGKVVSYELVAGIGTDAYTEGHKRAKASQAAQDRYVPLPPGMEAVTEQDLAEASSDKEALLREMGLLSDKADVAPAGEANSIREDLHPTFHADTQGRGAPKSGMAEPSELTEREPTAAELKRMADDVHPLDKVLKDG